MYCVCIGVAVVDCYSHVLDAVLSLVAILILPLHVWLSRSVSIVNMVTYYCVSYVRIVWYIDASDFSALFLK